MNDADSYRTIYSSCSCAVKGCTNATVLGSKYCCNHGNAWSRLSCLPKTCWLSLKDVTRRFAWRIHGDAARATGKVITRQGSHYATLRKIESLHPEDEMCTKKTVSKYCYNEKCRVDLIVIDLESCGGVERIVLVCTNSSNHSCEKHSCFYSMTAQVGLALRHIREGSVTLDAHATISSRTLIANGFYDCTSTSLDEKTFREIEKAMAREIKEFRGEMDKYK